MNDSELYPIGEQLAIQPFQVDYLRAYNLTDFCHITEYRSDMGWKRCCMVTQENQRWLSPVPMINDILIKQTDGYSEKQVFINGSDFDKDEDGCLWVSNEEGFCFPKYTVKTLMRKHPFVDVYLPFFDLKPKEK